MSRRRKNKEIRSEAKDTNPTPQQGPLYIGTPQHDPLYGAMYYGGTASPPKTGMFSDLSLTHFVRIARKKWMIILGVLALFLVVGALYLLFAKKEYRATTLLELSVRRPRIAGQQGALLDDTSRYYQPEETFFVTRMETIKGNATLELAAQMLKENYNEASYSEQDLKTILKKNSDIQLIRRSRLLQISVDLSDPTFAAAAANAYAEAVEASAMQENKSDSDNAVKWLEAQADAKQIELEETDGALVRFRAENKLDALENQKNSADNALQDFNRSLTEIESQRLLAKELYNTLFNLKLSPESAGKLPASIPRQAEIQNNLERWLDAIAERDALLTRYTKKHPEVIAQEKVVTALRAQVDNSIGRAIETAQSNLSLLSKQSESLRKRIQKESDKASDIELQLITKRSELARLEREKEAADISYRGILNRIEEARLSADEKTATVKIVDPSVPPEQPFKPRKKWVLAIALVLGMGGGLFLAMYIDYQDDYITSAYDVEALIGVKVLGLVPHIPSITRDDLATASLHNKFSHVAETFSGVRAYLDASHNKDISSSILVASSSPEEGKTITATNLAIVSAKSGCRTLLIDFDMRRPRLARIMKMPDNVQSLAHVLIKKDSALFPQMPIQTECPHLDIVVSRPDEKISPAEIISSSYVNDFLKWAEQNYDRIIIDSPPFGIISDAVVLAGYVDSVVLVCRPEHSRRRAVQHLVKSFDDIGSHVIGIVINDVDFSHSPLLSNFDYLYGHIDYKQHYKHPQQDITS